MRPVIATLMVVAGAAVGAASTAPHVVRARPGEVVTLEPPDGIAPGSAHWVELSGPGILLRRGEAPGPGLTVRPRAGGVYRFACLPDESASLLRARLFEVRVGEPGAAPRAVCPILVCAGDEVVVEADRTPGPALEIKSAVWKQLSGPRLELGRDELRRTTLRLVPELPGRYRFALKVAGCRGWATFTFEVPRNSKGGPERRPVARASPVMSARVGDEVALDGSRSADPDGGELVFRWEKLSGPPGELAGPSGGDGSRMRFLPGRAGEYTFALTVVDPAGFESLPVPVVLTVFPPAGPARADPAARDPLDRPFSIRLENAPASALIARLSDAGVTVRASSELTRARPFDGFTIDLWAVDLPARKVLDWLGRALGAFYVIERPGVVWFARGTRWLEREEPVVATHRIDALYSKDDASDLMSLLRDALKAALWARADLSLASPDLEAQTLTAVLPQSAQRRLARILAELRREVPSGRPGEERDRALGRLMSRPVRVRYERWPARDVAWDLARQARVVVGFMPMGAEGGRRVALDLGEVPLCEGLERLCRAAGLAGYSLEAPGVVWLFSKRPPPESSECLWSAAEVRSYDVRQLRAAHGFAGPMIVHLVKSRVLPARWKVPFVSIGYSRARRRLVVIHSAEVQRAVAAFLAHLGRRGEKALAE